MSVVSLIDTIQNGKERPDWDSYFMVMAQWAAKRSSCQRLHVGCIIVKDRRLVSTGYNGHLPGAPHTSVVVDGGEQMTIHAEQNAVADAASRGVAIAGATAYVTHMPCINCAKVLAAARVSRIVYQYDHKPNPLTLEILESGKIDLYRFEALSPIDEILTYTFGISPNNAQAKRQTDIIPEWGASYGTLYLAINTLFQSLPGYLPKLKVDGNNFWTLIEGPEPRLIRVTPQYESSLHMSVHKDTKDDKKDEKEKKSLLALTGAMYSGKSTVASHLAMKGYTELSFAEPLKELIIRLFKIDPKYVYDPKMKGVVIPKWGVSGRELAQVIGTELFRDGLPKNVPHLKLVAGGFWITLMHNRLQKTRGPCVISDCRFEDEHKYVKSQKGTVVKITRKGTEPTGVASHASEKGIDGDITIENNGSINELFAAFENF